MSTDAVELVLRCLVIPLWIAAGLADWWCHRRTAIERTSGVPENVFHWLLFAQGGVAVLAVAFLEIQAGVLLVVLAAFLAHEATTFVELRYTTPLRDVRPGEQMVHSLLEILPLAMLALLAALRQDEVAALFGAGSPQWGLHWKAQPWPPGYLVGMVAAVGVLNVVPLGEEMVRCWRARGAGRG